MPYAQPHPRVTDGRRAFHVSVLALCPVRLQIPVCSQERFRDAQLGGREREVQEVGCLQRGDWATRRSGGSCGEGTLRHDIDRQP